LIRQIMNILFVGLDVSSRHIDVCCMLQDGTVMAAFLVTNDLPGVAALGQKVAAILASRQLEHVLFGLEATSVYGWHVAHALPDVEVLRPYRPATHTFNPRIIRAFKKTLTYKPKNDRQDAWFIAEKLRQGRLAHSVQVDDRYEALRRLTRHRFHLVQSITAEKNRFLNNLFLKCSVAAQDKPISRLFGPTAASVLVEIHSVEELVATPIEQLVEILVKKSRGRLKAPEEVAAAVQKAANASYRLSKAMADSVNFVLATSLRTIRALEQEVKTLDAAIAELLVTIPQTLTSVKGIGPVFAAGIVAEVGGIHRFPHHPALARYAGLVWTEYESGNFRAQDTRLVKEGNQYLRYYLVEAAASLVVHNAEFKRYYETKRAEVKNHAEKRALALTARKLVRLVHALLRKDQLYRAPRTTGA
jgi:transposase